MLQRSEDVSLDVETTPQRARPLVVSQQLDRHLLPILTVGPLAQKHGAHAAVTELADDLVRAEALSQQGFRLERFGWRDRRDREKAPGLGGHREQRFDLRAEIGIYPA